MSTMSDDVTIYCTQVTVIQLGNQAISGWNQFFNHGSGNNKRPTYLDFLI